MNVLCKVHSVTVWSQLRLTATISSIVPVYLQCNKPLHGEGGTLTLCISFEAY